MKNFLKAKHLVYMGRYIENGHKTDQILLISNRDRFCVKICNCFSLNTKHMDKEDNRTDRQTKLNQFRKWKNGSVLSAFIVMIYNNYTISGLVYNNSNIFITLCLEFAAHVLQFCISMQMAPSFCLTH